MCLCLCSRWVIRYFFDSHRWRLVSNFLFLGIIPWNQIFNQFNLYSAQKYGGGKNKNTNFYLQIRREWFVRISILNRKYFHATEMDFLLTNLSNEIRLSCENVFMPNSLYWVMFYVAEYPSEYMCNKTVCEDK